MRVLFKYFVFLSVLFAFAGNVFSQQKVTKPLFDDPIYHGAADPVIIYNKQIKKWWMLYTNRRAALNDSTGVAWVHGTRIGIAESKDGKTWNYKDTANINYRPDNGYTFWAPDVIEHNGPSDTALNNIVFTSQWDNFSDSVIIPLSGKASKIYLLMAGSTNPMQSHITNGMIVVNYNDNTADTLLLENPNNWWPIEQDYYIDGYAFKNGRADPPERLYLKEGKFGKELSSYISIKGFSNRGIDGGAGTVLSMFLNNKKDLKSLTVYAIANDVVIGLMAATLVR